MYSLEYSEVDDETTGEGEVTGVYSSLTLLRAVVIVSIGF